MESDAPGALIGARERDGLRGEKCSGTVFPRATGKLVKKCFGTVFLRGRVAALVRAPEAQPGGAERVPCSVQSRRMDGERT